MVQKGVGRKLFFIGVFILCCTKSAIAGAPVPWGAKLLKEDVAVTNNQEKQVRSYETNTSKDEIIKYYLREMPLRGYALFMNGESNVVFTKGEEMTMVVAVPSGAGKTVFVIVEAPLKAGASETGLSGGGIQASCEDVPSVPVYPGARCSQSMRLKSENTRSATYSAVGSIADVLGFYRSQMPQYMWKLAKELDLGKDMPARSPFEGAYGLYFTNPKGNGCMVSVMDTPGMKGLLIITIAYEEKSSM